MKAVKDFALRCFATLLALPIAYFGWIVLQHQSSAAFEIAVIIWALCIAWVCAVWKD